MDKLSTIKSETEALLSKIIDKFEVAVNEEEGIFQIDIKSEEEVSTVIGRHGETIRAIQKLLEVILYKKLGEGVDLLVNVNDFREKQKERLETLAAEYAENTKTSGNPSYLKNLSSFERKIIHEFITANYPDLISSSVGEGRDRQLVIEVRK